MMLICFKHFRGIEHKSSGISSKLKHLPLTWHNFEWVIHLVLTHKGREGVKQKRTPCVQGGGGLTHGSTYAKTSLFARVL